MSQEATTKRTRKTREFPSEARTLPLKAMIRRFNEKKIHFVFRVCNLNN
jgi:hypothetical protein